MIKRTFKIFADFDGTITLKDVGDELFRNFAERSEVDRIIADLLAHRISAKQCWVDLCNITTVPGEEEVNNFIATIPVDPHFRKFVEFTKDNELELFIVSDGFDFYIDRILEKELVTGVKYYSNKLRIENGKLLPEFPYEAPHCHTSANCKRTHILNNSSEEDITIYIGDGNSDFYAAQFCDYIFAKDSLLKHCERERISFFPYKDFNDVIKRLEVLISKKNIKKRHQAELKRREVYLLEY